MELGSRSLVSWSSPRFNVQVGVVAGGAIVGVALGNGEVGDDVVGVRPTLPHRHGYKRAASTFRVNDWTLNQIDPDGLRYLATISVRANWFVAAIASIELVYRPYLDFGVARYATYVLLVLVLIGFNGYIHYRILSNRRTTWRWLFALYALDVFLVSAMAASSDGFSHDFVHRFYYPALALMAVLFASFRLNMVWVTITSLVYVVISLTVGDGIDTEARDEKALLARIAVMYVVVTAVNLATRFERMRWGQAVERERALQRERVELSQAIHDTAAQSAYMVGLGIDTAKALAGDANPEHRFKVSRGQPLQVETSKQSLGSLGRPLVALHYFRVEPLGCYLLGHLGHPGYPHRHRPQAHGQFTSRVVPVPIPTKCLAPHIAVTAQGGDGPGR